MIEWDVEDHPISKAGKKYTGKPVTEEKTYMIIPLDQPGRSTDSEEQSIK